MVKIDTNLKRIVQFIDDRVSTRIHNLEGTDRASDVIRGVMISSLIPDIRESILTVIKEKG